MYINPDVETNNHGVEVSLISNQTGNIVKTNTVSPDIKDISIQNGASNYDIYWNYGYAGLKNAEFKCRGIINFVLVDEYEARGIVINQNLYLELLNLSESENITDIEIKGQVPFLSTVNLNGTDISQQTAANLVQ